MSGPRDIGGGAGDGANESQGDTPSTRPYLVRAIFDWCLDSGQTPQIMVNAEYPQVVAPLGYAKDGKIVLNLHPNSVRGLEIGNDYLMFSARFSGKAEEIVVPVQAVMAIYARENGQGIVFQADGSSMTPPEQRPSAPESHSSGDSGVASPDSAGGKRGSSHLRVVK